MSDKIRRFEKKAIREPEPLRDREPEPLRDREPEPLRDREPVYWSLSEAMDIGTSILALMEREVLASQVE